MVDRFCAIHVGIFFIFPFFFLSRVKCCSKRLATDSKKGFPAPLNSSWPCQSNFPPSDLDVFLRSFLLCALWSFPRLWCERGLMVSYPGCGKCLVSWLCPMPCTLTVPSALYPCCAHARPPNSGAGDRLSMLLHRRKTPLRSPTLPGLTQGLASVHPLHAFYPGLTPLPWHPATQSMHRLSHAACTHARTHARTQHVPRHGDSDCVGVSTQPNSITLVCGAPLIPPPLFLYIDRFARTFMSLFSLLFIFRSPRPIRGSWCRTQA